MKVILDIDVSNGKALALLNYIRTLDFIKIQEKDSDTDEYSLSDDQIQVLEQRKEYHTKNKSKSHNWEDIKEEMQYEDAIFAQL